MYRESKDLRFVKNKHALQRAFIDLTLEKKSSRITVKDLAEKANVNRMTFYAHYDTVEDVLLEIVDEMTAELISIQNEKSAFDVEGLLTKATAMMEAEIGFYKLIAQNDGFEKHRAQFRKAFENIFLEKLERCSQLVDPMRKLASDMLASSITYAYLDWLAGEYEGLSLDDLISFCQQTLQSQVTLWSDSGA